MPFKLPHLNQRQQVAITGGALIFIVLVITFASRIRPLGNPSAQLPPARQGAPAPTVAAPSATATPKTSPTARPTATPKPTDLSYGNALAKYGDWRIQLNSKCQAQPAKMTVKTGTSILLDNRTATQKIATLDGKVYKLPAYGFQIIRMTAQTLPHTAILHCDPLKNVAQITILK